jgi:hypothetical protein
MQVGQWARRICMATVSAVLLPWVGAGSAMATTAAVLPTVVVTSPVGGVTVSGVVQVAATGHIDASQTDTGQAMYLYVDGHLYSSPYGVGCPTVVADAGSCPVTFDWDTSGLTGAHQLAVQFVTDAHTVSSPTVTVFVFSATDTVLSAVHPVPAGQRIVMLGQVSTAIGHAPVAGARVTLIFTPLVGSPRTVTVTTNVSGRFSARLLAGSGGTLRAAAAVSTRYGGSTAAERVVVLAPVTCTVGATVAIGALDHGRCRVSGMPKGNAVTLQYKAHGQWFLLGKGKAPAGGAFVFGVRFGKPGTVYIRVVVGSSRLYGLTYGAPMKVTVR